MPVAAVFIKCLGDSTPSYIAGKPFLLLRSGKPVFRFQCFQHIDGIHVGTEFCFGPTGSEVVICDTEVVEFGRRYLYFSTKLSMADPFHLSIRSQIDDNVARTGIIRAFLCLWMACFW